MKALFLPVYIRRIYIVFNSLSAGIHHQNDLKVIWIIFHENPAFLLVESLYLNANSGLIYITIIVGSSYADKLKREKKKRNET